VENDVESVAERLPTELLDGEDRSLADPEESDDSEGVADPVEAELIVRASVGDVEELVDCDKEVDVDPVPVDVVVAEAEDVLDDDGSSDAAPLDVELLECDSIAEWVAVP
jgi:hypothetical protein